MISKGIGTLVAAMAFVLLVSVPAQAVTADTLIGSIDSAQSGQAYEEAQLEIACGCDITLLANVGFTDAGVQHDGLVNYINVAPSTPGYFLLKFGTGATGDDMFFFQNIAELTLLAWTDAQLIAAGLDPAHVDSISHYAITTSIPTVPDGGATLGLLGLAMLGLGYLRRRKQ